MPDFLALITNKKYWFFHSWVIKNILKIYGIRVGKNFYIEGIPKLKLRGNPLNISIGDNVSIFGDIDIRNRENGKIMIDDGVSIDNDCRLVSANDAVLKIGKRTSIGPFCVFNCGTDVTIGEDCLISGMIFIQSSQHGFNKGSLIKAGKFAGISVYGDVWAMSVCTLAPVTV